MGDGERKAVDVWELSDLCTPWCVHVVATLRVAQHMEDGIARIDELAAACGADTDFLHRVLRHLAAKGLFEERAPGHFALNPPARALLESAVLLGLDLDSFGGRMANAWGGLLSTVRTGEPAYREIFGRPYWEDLDAHPEIAAKFDELMGPAGHGAPNANIELDGGWDSVGTVVDVGGGTGALLAELLRTRPALKGTLVDRPGTIARSHETFAAAGVAGRVTTAAQSFFDPLPAGADLYLLKSVLSDWGDPEASLILRRCAEAARPAGRVVLLNGVSPDEAGGPPPDVLMMVLVGGKGRTLAEFRELARAAGLEVVMAGRQPAGRFVVECRPAS